MKSRNLLCLPVALVAVVSLALGSIGTATASGLTTGAVKKIASKVIKKQAPGLSVAHATTAASATTADHATTADSAATARNATTADNATTAGNATDLGGQPASAYLDRVAFDAVPTVSVADSVNTTLVGPVSLTVPEGTSFVHVLGQASWYNGSTSYYMWYEMDTACTLSGPGVTYPTYGTTNYTQSSIVSLVVPVGPGTHTFRLCGRAGAAVTAASDTLTVETVATGATGGSTLTRPAGARPHGLRRPR